MQNYTRYLDSSSFIMNSIELNKVTRDQTTQAEKILAMAKFFSDLADREALKVLRTIQKDERQATSPMSEDWDDELRREGISYLTIVKSLPILPTRRL